MVEELCYPAVNIYVPIKKEEKIITCRIQNVILQGTHIIRNREIHVENNTLCAYHHAKDIGLKYINNGKLEAITNEEDLGKYLKYYNDSTFRSLRILGMHDRSKIKYMGGEFECDYSSYDVYYKYKKISSNFSKFVSAESKTWGGKETKVNFEVMLDEIINMTYLNSLFIKHAIMNKDVGS